MTIVRKLVDNLIYCWMPNIAHIWMFFCVHVIQDERFKVPLCLNIASHNTQHLQNKYISFWGFKVKDNKQKWSNHFTIPFQHENIVHMHISKCYLKLFSKKVLTSLENSCRCSLSCNCEEELWRTTRKCCVKQCDWDPEINNTENNK